MIDYERVNEFIGQDWVYLENDCWAVFRKASLSIFGVAIHEVEIAGESSPEQTARLMNENKLNPEWVKTEKPLPGSLVFISDSRGNPVHVGLYISSGDVLHCPGTIKKPGKVALDSISILERLRSIYSQFEYYTYAPDNHD